jgi:hypothetical protein
MKKEKFLKMAQGIHGYKYNYDNVPEKITYKDKIVVEFGGVFYEQTVAKHLMGRCPEKVTKSKEKEEFIRQSKEVWGNRYDYSSLEYNSLNKKIKIFDRQRNTFVEQVAALHVNGHEAKKLDTAEFIEISQIISDFAYTYDKCIYSNKTTNVTITCPIHGDFIVKPFNHINYGSVCRKCFLHLFNKSIISLLSKDKISFIQQYKFSTNEEMASYPFDFYLPSFRMCLDFEPVRFNPISYERIKAISEVKQSYCEENFIDLIRIRYDRIDSISDILWESLKFKILGI